MLKPEMNFVSGFWVETIDDNGILIFDEQGSMRRVPCSSLFPKRMQQKSAFMTTDSTTFK